MGEAIAEEYRSSLCDLNFNSKPHINMLTMVADDNNQYAPLIVETIAKHIKTVQPDLKLPSLYLVDSIMKNIGGQYIVLFCKHMVTLFSTVFAKVDESTRSALYKLRQTWNEILPKNILYEIDCKVNDIDPAWPITAKAPVAKIAASAPKNAIHINPKFLGGSPQASHLPRTQTNPAVMKKNEAMKKDPEKEVKELKEKQEEMLRLINEKKVQLRALEQKKIEMAEKQKKKLGEGTVFISQQELQKKHVNHRDPRLKKSAIMNLPTVDGAKNSSSLQSIVIVPKVPLGANVNQTGEGLKPVKKVNPKNESQNQGTSNEAFHHSGKVDQGIKNIDKNESIEKLSKENNKDKNALNKEQSNKSDKNFNKKHPLSPEKSLQRNNSAKRFCKQPFNKMKPPVAHGRLQQFQDGGPVTKKGKYNHKSKNKNNEMHVPNFDVKDSSISIDNKDKMHPSNQRLRNSPLYSNEDIDYRHQRMSAIPKSKQWQRGEMHPRMSQDMFYSRNNKVDDRPMNIGDQKAFMRDSEKYPAIKLESDQDLLKVDDRRPINNLDKLQDLDVNRLPAKTEISEQAYNSNPIMTRDRLSNQLSKTLMLDGKNHQLYFINNRCLTVMDNNEPRELTFTGIPRNVYIEGIPKPLVLGFDGRSLEFETEGKRNSIRFGTPSREVYVNNHPHEAFFGGKYFTAILEDNKEHRIRIDGPPPQVKISEKPAYELFEMYNRNKRISPIPPMMEPTLNNTGPEAAMLQDVDMRRKPIPKSSILSEATKDVDWRHVPPDGPQMPWDIQKDVPTAANRNYSGPSEIPGPSQWDKNSNMGIHCDSIERNNDLCNAPWPHSGYRSDVLQVGERPSYDQPLHVNQKAQPVPGNMWERQPTSSLPPPPAIPASLSSAALSLPLPPNLPSLSSLSGPNLNLPPPSWNPLPPPPMFTGSVPETLKPVSLPSVSSASNMSQPVVTESTISLPTLPVNVETIYEKLVAAGLVKKTEEPPSTTAESTNSKEKPSTDKTDSLPEEEETPEPEILLTPKSLRQFRPSVIVNLYKGSQCATCGMRFKEIQSEQYSRHLDWHFRMNRREKDGAKKAYSRRLFYEIKDWIQFKEIEEAEERTPSYFELQADGDTSKNEEKEKIQSVPASGETEKCAVCSDQFQLFWVEEEEEWHLRHAVRHDGEAYHPMCYEDFQKATELAKKEAEESLSDSAKEEEKVASEETSSSETKAENPSENNEESPTSETSTNAKIKEEPKETEDIEMKEESQGEETSETPVKEPDSEAPKEEAVVRVKEEIVDELSEDNAATITSKATPEETMEVEPGDQETSTSAAEAVQTEKEEESTVEVTTKQDKNMVSSSDADSDNFEDEFRPPTPDPRFNVQPPVTKGTELSALCTIM